MDESSGLGLQGIKLQGIKLQGIKFQSVKLSLELRIKGLVIGEIFSLHSIGLVHSNSDALGAVGVIAWLCGPGGFFRVFLRR